LTVLLDTFAGHQFSFFLQVLPVVLLYDPLAIELSQV